MYSIFSLTSFILFSNHLLLILLIHFSQDLNFCNHIEHMVGKSSKYLGFIKYYSSELRDS